MKLSPTQIKEIAERAEKATYEARIAAFLGTLDFGATRRGVIDIYRAGVSDIAREADTHIAKLERELETERIGLQHMEIGIVNGKPVAEFTMDGSASKRIIEALCIHFAEKGGENFVETSFEIHPAVTSPPGVQKVGDFYFTIQRKNGSTPGQQLTEARARIAQLERERDEAKSAFDAAWAKNREIGKALGAHPDEPRSDMELLDDLFNQFRGAESDRDEACARIAQLESQIAMKDGALRFYAEEKNYGLIPGAEPADDEPAPVQDDGGAKAREALKGSAK